MQNNLTMLMVLISLFVYSEARTQTFLPFPTKNAEWSAVVTQVGDYDPIYTTSHYAPQGDTIIQNKVFTKLYVNTGRVFNIDVAKYIGAYINESKRVFFIDKGKLNPRLLYDFNVPIGWIARTFRNCDTSEVGCRFNQLTSIDTVMYDDHIKRARYNFDWFSKQFNGSIALLGSLRHSWIEGIGSTLGFFPEPSNSLFSPVTPQSFKDLLCFKLSDTLIYTHPLLYKGECYIDVISDVKSLNDSKLVNIYPNPAFEKLFVQHDLTVSKNSASIFLIDMMGRVVLEKPLDASLLQMDVSSISPGIYFIRILSKDGQVNVCKKIIKSK